jgi:hypothetical protein
MVGETLFIVGAEVRTPGGTLLAFPLSEPLPEEGTLAGFIEAIHAQGGVVIVGHAEQFTGYEAVGIDGIEVHNLHAAATRASGAWLVLKALFAPIGTLFTSLTQVDPEVLLRWDGMLARGLATPVGGHDAHANIRLFGGVIGDYPDTFAILSTHVLAAGLDEESVVEALRRGRSEHGRLHVARAGAWPFGGPPRRHLGLWRRALRDVDRPAPVRRRLGE